MTDHKILRLYALRHQHEFVISSLAFLSIACYLAILVLGLIAAFLLPSSLQVILLIAAPFVLTDRAITDRVTYHRNHLNLIRNVIGKLGTYSDRELRAIVESLELYTPRIPRSLREIPANRTARWSKFAQQPLPWLARRWERWIEKY